MTLEEAKEIVKEHCMYESPVEDVEEAIETVLKTLEEYEKQLDLDYVRENYIPKEEVRNKMEEMNKIIKNAEPIEAVFMIKQQQALHELLMGE